MSDKVIDRLENIETRDFLYWVANEIACSGGGARFDQIASAEGRADLLRGVDGGAA